MAEALTPYDFGGEDTPHAFDVRRLLPEAHRVQATIAELEQALADLRGQMVAVRDEGDAELYVALANRYGRLHGKWEQAKSSAPAQ